MRNMFLFLGLFEANPRILSVCSSLFPYFVLGWLSTYTFQQTNIKYGKYHHFSWDNHGKATLAATEQAFAVWGLGGDGIITWGSPTAGGDSPFVTHQLRRGEARWLRGSSHGFGESE